MGDQHGDRLELGQVAAEPGADLQAGTGVQGRQRFVQEQQPGAGGQGAGEGHALGLAAGQASRFGARVGRQAHPLQPRRRVGAGLRLADALAAGAEGDVVQGGQVGEEEVVLEDDADRPGLRGRVGQGSAVQVEVTVGEGGETGEGAQGGGLAGAVGAQQGEDVSGGGSQGHVQAEGASVDHEVGVEAGGLVWVCGGRPAFGRLPVSTRTTRAGPVVRCGWPLWAGSAAGRCGRAPCGVGGVGGPGVGCRHEGVIQRSLRPASTAIDTVSRTRLREMAASGSFCRAR